jgi:hypothetical protein
VAVVAVIGLWAGLSASPIGNDSGTTESAPAVRARSVAFAVAEGNEDVIYVRSAAADVAPARIAAFPHAYNRHLRGEASPMADQIAILHVGSDPVAPARLSLLDLQGPTVSQVEGEFDALSPIAWARDGSRLALISPDAEGEAHVSRVMEVRVGTHEVRELARFVSPIEVAPVGYSFDLESLYVVVVDQTGSTLWVIDGEGARPRAALSPGPTRDWSLSPDGARLAFIERLGASGRSFAARVLTIATGNVAQAAAAGDQLGSAWLPGATLPTFGGPDGTLRLTDPNPGEYVIPIRYAPDGSSLVAAVYTPSRDGRPATRSIEVVTPERRLLLSEAPAIQFLGYVRDLESAALPITLDIPPGDQ